ncbi:MAG: glycosyltransferase family 4 protein [Janthinobacterium lividum]
MKVAHIVRQFSPAIGGLEEAVHSIARSQRDQLGIDAHIITLNRIFDKPDYLPVHDVVDGIPVLRLPWTGSTRYPLAPSVLRHVYSFDLLHVHAIDFFFDFLALSRPLHWRPMVASTHGGFFHSKELAKLKRIWFSTVTRASTLAYQRIIACSHHDAELFKPVAGDRLTTIENGINQSKFSGASSEIPCRTIISYGRFAKHKRLDALFPVLAQLHKNDSTWRLIIAGSYGDQTESELRNSAIGAGVGDLVEFVIGPTDGELKSLLARCSYFASFSAHEGFGLAAVEAMSAGLFPLLSGIEPFRRLVSAAGVGLILDPDDVTQTSSAIASSVTTDMEIYTRRRAQCMQAVRRYDWNAVARLYTDLYHDVLSSKRSTHATTSQPLG